MPLPDTASVQSPGEREPTYSDNCDPAAHSGTRRCVTPPQRSGQPVELIPEAGDFARCWLVFVVLGFVAAKVCRRSEQMRVGCNYTVYGTGREIETSQRRGEREERGRGRERVRGYAQRNGDIMSHRRDRNRGRHRFIPRTRDLPALHLALGAGTEPLRRL